MYIFRVNFHTLALLHGLILSWVYQRRKNKGNFYNICIYIYIYEAKNKFLIPLYFRREYSYFRSVVKLNITVRWNVKLKMYKISKITNQFFYFLSHLIRSQDLNGYG